MERSKKDPAWPLWRLETLLVPIYWISDTSPSTAGGKASITEVSPQKRKGLQETAVDSWWKRSIWKPNSMFSPVIYILKHTKKAVFHNLFHIENDIYVIHWAKWKSLLVAEILVKMLWDKILKAAKNVPNCLKKQWTLTWWLLPWCYKKPLLKPSSQARANTSASSCTSEYF